MQVFTVSSNVYKSHLVARSEQIHFDQLVKIRNKTMSFLQEVTFNLGIILNIYFQAQRSLERVQTVSTKHVLHVCPQAFSRFSDKFAEEMVEVTKNLSEHKIRFLHTAEDPQSFDPYPHFIVGKCPINFVF